MTLAQLPHFTCCGLPGIGHIPYGMHACHFYSHHDQIVAALVPYFAAGLREKERCLWVTAPPLPAREAATLLRAAHNGVDDAIQSGALRILDFDQWYGSSARLKGLEVVQFWLDEEERALAEGYNGLRITENTSFLQPGDWPTFLEYEQALTQRFTGRRIVALCSYALAHCSDQRISEVMQAHQFAFECPAGEWQATTRPRAQATTGGTSIKRPVSEAQTDLRLLLDSAAQAICSIDTKGAITFCNASFLRILGYRQNEEVIGKDFHGLVRHSRADGSPYSRADCPVLKAAWGGIEAHAADEVFYRADGTNFPVEYWARPIARESSIDGAVCTFVDITERKQSAAEQRLLNHELAHRVRNTLAVVQAIVDQTLRTRRVSNDAIRAINARLFALSQAHEVLTRTQWDGADIADVVKSGIAVFGADNSRILIEGPPMQVGPGTALALTMALHELCTNAIKYGALSNDTGHVELVWASRQVVHNPRFRLRWKERGGPRVTAPARKGFGSRIIHEHCKSHLGGNVDLLFEPEGVEWTLDTPLSFTKR